MTAFIAEAYSRGWVLPGFDWSGWIARDGARRLATDPGAIGDAPAADLFRLLTTVLRQERFREGAFLNAAQAGIIEAIARSAAVLAGERSAGHPPA